MAINKERLNEKSNCRFFKIAHPVESQAAPTKCYSTVYVKSEDYGLEEGAAPSNMRRLE